MFLKLFLSTCLLSLLIGCNDDPKTVKSSAYVPPCPEDFSLVGQNFELATEEFCVSQDLMSLDASSRLVVRAGATPAVIVSATDAELMCKSLGAKYDLISLPEYQAVALEVETGDENWSGNKIGAGSLGWNQDEAGAATTFKNHSTVKSGATVDGLGAINRSGGIDAYQTWTKDNLNSYYTTGSSLNLKAGDFHIQGFPVGDLNSPYEEVSKWFAPRGDYRSLPHLALGDAGLGVLSLDSSSGRLVRGPLTGATFQAELTSVLPSANIGFHCVYHPN